MARRILLKPYSINGTGIRLLDYRPVGHGVYEATRWLTLFYVPLVPISTWLIRPGTMEGDGLGMEFNYEILDTRPLRVSGVLRKYGMTVLAALPLAIALYLVPSGRPATRLEVTGLLLSLAWFMGVLFLGERSDANVYSAPPTQPLPSGGDPRARSPE